MSEEELIEKIAYKLFTFYGSGNRFAKFDDIKEAKTLISIIRTQDKAGVVEAFVQSNSNDPVTIKQHISIVKAIESYYGNK